MTDATELSEEDLQAGWDAAVTACLHGHEDCSYGGMSPQGGYWLADTECPLNHGERCAWCPAPATTGFPGWADGTILGDIYRVPGCDPHAAQWAEAHPEWVRGG